MRRFCKHETVWHSVTIYIQNIIVEHSYLVSYYVTRITILACYFQQKCSKYSPLLCFPYSGTTTANKSVYALLFGIVPRKYVGYVNTRYFLCA
jgi:hypothetical protein